MEIFCVVYFDALTSVVIRLPSASVRLSHVTAPNDLLFADRGSFASVLICDRSSWSITRRRCVLALMTGCCCAAALNWRRVRRHNINVFLFCFVVVLSAERDVENVSSRKQSLYLLLGRGMEWEPESLIWRRLRLRRDGRLSWPWVADLLHNEISVRHRELNPDTVAHLSTNRARRRLTSLIEADSGFSWSQWLVVVSAKRHILADDGKA